MFLKALAIDPMFPRQLFLGFFGICAGSIIAAGVFAFLSMIGVFPRLMGWSRTPGQAKIYETATVLGGIWGNLLNLYNHPTGKSSVRPDFSWHRRTVHRHFCRMSGHVPGRDGKSTACNEPENPSGRGFSICHSGNRTGKTERISALLFPGYERTVTRSKTVWLHI